LRAVAAALLVIGLVGAFLYTFSSAPAQASVADMARMHEDLVSGKTPVTQVDSIDAANRELTKQWPGSPGLPKVPQQHVMACCMKSVHDKKMACVLLKDQGVPITLAVASAADMKVAPAPVMSRNGIDYRVQKVGDLSMVMTEHSGKWLCLIGQIPAERLMDVAAQVRF
jgi:hypothetical protein